ncbi:MULTISPECIES: hypothetical protein [Myxococcus]|uniref:hypothetical protein n=1 Tax=Myxococcus TaxID=32 RepID=UPI0013D33D5F|nr:hypothetical protein [Myxococcus eversor]NVJ28033.1 hypothetical protein [Myxococcus sp. AM011]
MRYLFILWPVAWLTACSGPEAPDAAVCRDVVTRLCQTSACPGVAEQLPPGLDCEATLLERTGCGAEEFTFSSPSRERVLDCREPLIRVGTTTERPPSCEDTRQFLVDCPDVTAFFRGEEP